MFSHCPKELSHQFEIWQSAASYGSTSWELQKPWGDTINQCTERANSTAVLVRCTTEGNIPVHHCQPGWKSHQLQGGRDTSKDRPLRYQHLPPPPRKLKLCSFDVKTEFILNCSLLKQAGKSISCSYGNTAQEPFTGRNGSAEGWNWARDRAQSLPSSHKALSEQKLEPWLYGQIPILSLSTGLKSERAEMQDSLYCAHWLLWFNCNHFEHWKCIFVFARTILC